MLHITNGDCAVPALRAAGARGAVLPWSEVLHNGPVPGGLDAAALREVRARYLSAEGARSEAATLALLEARDERLDAALGAGEPIVLWFEADLYDVLLLIQVLDRVPDRAPVELVLVGQAEWTSVTHVEPRRLAEIARRAPRVGPERLQLARTAWAAFTSSAPTALEPLAWGTPALPAIGQALRRLLEELPWVGTGLGRTERQLLAALADGASTREEAFKAAARAEERPFLGDASAFAALDRLAPLLDGDVPNARGRAVLAGGEEWSPAQERWIGGVRLPPGPSPWRWDPGAGRIDARPRP